jgi:integrase
MATIKEVVLKHHKKTDGTYNIKYRLTHNRQTAYINSMHFVTDKQLKKNLTLKDSFLIATISGELTEYRKKISKFSHLIDQFDIKELLNLLIEDYSNEQVDFIKFGHAHIAMLRSKGHSGSANNLNTVLNSLCDYFKTDSVEITKINSFMLPEYELYLRKQRTLTRLNQFKRPVTYKVNGMSDAGVHNHLRDLRLLFNAARDKYNDEDRGIIKIRHYPFKKYKIIDAPATKKKARSIDEFIAIRDLKCLPGSRAELGRDIFMLSFYLCGMNSVDIYNYEWKGEKRVEYCRAKTTGRRQDKAFISVKLVPEAAAILRKYTGKLKTRYADAKNFNKAVNIGLARIATDLEYKALAFYDARHTVGTWARNICRCSKDDVAMALNHIDQSRKTTDVYISPDWTIVDDVQNKVLGLLKKKGLNNPNCREAEIARKSMRLITT